MTNFLPFRWIFVIFGFTLQRYIVKTDEFEFDPLLIGYSIVVSSVITWYRTYSLYLQQIMVDETKSFEDTKHELIGYFLVYLDFILLYMLSLSTIYLFYAKRKEHLKLLNFLVRFQKDYKELGTGDDTMKNILPLVWILILIFISCPLMNLYLVFSGDITININPWLYVITLYTYSIQYFFGHVYEFLIFMKIQSFFENCIPTSKKVNIRKYLDGYIELLSISQCCGRMFQFNKMICVTLCKVLISIYLFYQLDKNISDLIDVLMWEAMVSIIFVTCYAWDGLCWKVCELQLKYLEKGRYY